MVFHFLSEVRIVSFEAVKLNDHDCRSFINFKGFGGFHVLFARTAVPLIPLSQLLSLTELVKAVLNGYLFFIISLIKTPFVLLLAPRM